jgi:hypothetical protein
MAVPCKLVLFNFTFNIYERKRRILTLSTVNFIFLKLFKAASSLVNHIRGDKKHDNSNDLATCTVLAVGLRWKAPFSWNSPECSKRSHNQYITVGAKAGWGLPGKILRNVKI